MQQTRRWIVFGRVQGVYFRETTKRKAQDLGLNGWVRNLITGEVEVMATGETDQLDALEVYLWQGPSDADVRDVKVELCTLEHFTDFSIRALTTDEGHLSR